MKDLAPTRHGSAIVLVSVLGSLVIAYLLWGIISVAAVKMQATFGDAPLPMFTERLVLHCNVVWLLPVFGLFIGTGIILKKKSTGINLLLFVSCLTFLTLVAVTLVFTILVLPWLRV
jgi:hypothetical protein